MIAILSGFGEKMPLHKKAAVMSRGLSE